MAAEQIQYIPLHRITAAPQVREGFDEAALAGLAETLREVGQQHPIRLRREGELLIIVDGERRFRAAKKAGLTDLAAIVEDGELTPGAVIHHQLVCNCQREDLSPLEKAKAVSQLMSETGWSATQVATKLGFSNSMVSRLLALRTLCPEIQERIRTGDLPMSAACEIARVTDAAEQLKLAGQVANGQLTRDALSGEVKRKNGQPSASVLTTPSRVTAKLSNSRSVTVSASGLTLDSFIALLEELLRRAREARPKGMALSTFLRVLQDTAKSNP